MIDHKARSRKEAATSDSYEFWKTAAKNVENRGQASAGLEHLDDRDRLDQISVQWLSLNFSAARLLQVPEPIGGRQKTQEWQARN